MCDTNTRLPAHHPQGSSEIRVLEVRHRLGSQAPRGTRVIRNGRPPRVIRTPATMTRPPTIWPGRIGSARNAAASSTASAGTRNWYAAVRVGPTTRIPFSTTPFETPAARNPEYSTAPRTPGVNASADTVVSWTVAIGARTTVPATVAQAVALSGEYRPRYGAPNAM